MNNSYDKLKVKQLDAFPILSDSLDYLLRSVYRRIKANPSVRSPWKINSKSKIHISLFSEFFKAVKNWSSEFGRTLNTEKKKNGTIKSLSITFTHKGTLQFHLSQATGKSVKAYLKKTLKGGSHGRVIITAEKPFIMNYSVARGELSVSASYEIINRYGNVCM